MAFLLITIGLVVFIIFLSWMISVSDKANKYRSLKPSLDNLDSHKKELDSYKDNLDSREAALIDKQKNCEKEQQKLMSLKESIKEDFADKEAKHIKSIKIEYEKKEAEFRNKRLEWKKEQENKVELDIEAIKLLAKEKSQGFPWLAEAYAEYLYLQDLKRSQFLHSKSHPAKKAAEELKRIAHEKREAEKLHRIYKYQLLYYESLFPWLIDFKDEDIDDLRIQVQERKSFKEENSDPARIWLNDWEYEELSSVEKYQLALDRYWKKEKSKWEIGRDFERYIGYLYETKGYQVEYKGIIEGFADLGRDIIAIKGKYS